MPETGIGAALRRVISTVLGPRLDALIGRLERVFI